MKKFNIDKKFLNLGLMIAILVFVILIFKITLREGVGEDYTTRNDGSTAGSHFRWDSDNLGTGTGTGRNNPIQKSANRFCMTHSSPKHRHWKRIKIGVGPGAFNGFMTKKKGGAEFQRDRDIECCIMKENQKQNTTHKKDHPWCTELINHVKESAVNYMQFREEKLSGGRIYKHHSGYNLGKEI